MNRPPNGVANLPAASQDETAQEQRVRDLIADRIAAAGGQISFAEYMQLALYAPNLGYYSGAKEKLGAVGDFVTAPELSPLFARSIARQVADILRELGGGSLLEVGPGSGALAADLLCELEALGVLPQQLLLLDVSGSLRRIQESTLRTRLPHLVGRIQWLDRWPSRPFNGVVIANELLDALPVHRFEIDGNAFYESYVADGANGFCWRRQPLTVGPLWERVRAVAQELSASGYDGPYLSEINLAMDAWLASLGHHMERGVVLLFDYGFPQHEYYHPDRNMGTIMCHFHHFAHGNPLVLSGIQDITSHVDFTAAAMAATSAGFDVLGYTTQAHFLLGCGLTELLAELSPDEPQQFLVASNAVKKLTMPNEMGEIIKVLALGKGVDRSLRGFHMLDLRHKL